MPNEGEISALIQLLDDNDPEVYRHVHDKLLSYGKDVIGILEQTWSADINPHVHERIEDIIHEIQFSYLVKEWEQWATADKPDLFTGAYLIAKYHYPELTSDLLHKQINKLKQSIWLELNNNQTPLEQIYIFNQVFYKYHEFKGVQNSEDFQDFCINTVLESKKGNAISIGIIYQVVANELTLPVYGVNLIHHYILAFCKKLIFEFNSDENQERDIMFYINPINKGTIFSRHEIQDYLKKMNEEAREEYFIPAGNNSIIQEQLRYLIEIYERQNRSDKAAELAYLAKFLNN